LYQVRLGENRRTWELQTPHFWGRSLLCATCFKHLPTFVAKHLHVLLVGESSILLTWLAIVLLLTSPLVPFLWLRSPICFATHPICNPRFTVPIVRHALEDVCPVRGLGIWVSMNLPHEPHELFLASIG
jgi:hypothetical protein